MNPSGSNSLRSFPRKRETISAFTRVFDALWGRGPWLWAPAFAGANGSKVPTAAFGRLFSWRKRMAPTPEQTELGYHRMWDRAQIAAGKLEGARSHMRW